MLKRIHDMVIGQEGGSIRSPRLFPSLSPGQVQLLRIQSLENRSAYEKLHRKFTTKCVSEEKRRYSISIGLELEQP
jgi:hypothetical protein